MDRSKLRKLRSAQTHAMGDLSVAQDLAHGKKRYLFQRLGWAAMAIFLALALGGFLDEGGVDSVPRAETVLRAGFIYFFLLLVFNIAPKRALASVDTFDFVLLLIISEATQNALVGQDDSLAQAATVIVTLVGLTIAVSWLKQRYTRVERILSGTPIVLAHEGKLFEERMRQCQVDEADLLYAARETHGLERLDQIKFAVLEVNGQITVIPADEPSGKAA